MSKLSNKSKVEILGVAIRVVEIFDHPSNSDQVMLLLGSADGHHTAWISQQDLRLSLCVSCPSALADGDGGKVIKYPDIPSAVLRQYLASAERRARHVDEVVKQCGPGNFTDLEIAADLAATNPRSSSVLRLMRSPDGTIEGLDACEYLSLT